MSVCQFYVSSATLFSVCLLVLYKLSATSRCVCQFYVNSATLFSVCLLVLYKLSATSRCPFFSSMSAQLHYFQCVSSIYTKLLLSLRLSVLCITGYVPLHARALCLSILCKVSYILVNACQFFVNYATSQCVFIGSL